MNHFVGIDMGSQKNAVSVIDEAATVLKELEIGNSLEEFQRLDPYLGGGKEVLVCCEGVHGPLLEYLKHRGTRLYPVNPLKIKRFREMRALSGDKHDRLDARCLAEYLRENHQRMRPFCQYSEAVEELNLLRISHDRVTKEHARYANKLIFLLREYFPLYEGLFSTAAPQILLQLILAYPTWQSLRASSEMQLRQFFIEHNYRRRRSTERIIEAIRRYDQLVGGEVQQVLAEEARMAASILLLLNERLKQLEARMKQIMDSHRLGAVFCSIPGAGKVLAGKLMALLGDNKSRFAKAGEVQALFGTAPVNFQTGNYHKVRMRWGCNRRARATLFYFAFCSMRYCPWARAYYDRQRQKGKTHAISVRALSNKWLRVLFQMWKSEQRYDKERCMSLMASRAA